MPDGPGQPAGTGSGGCTVHRFFFHHVAIDQIEMRSERSTISASGTPPAQPFTKAKPAESILVRVEELARLLDHVDLFDGLDRSTLEALADQLEVEYASAGTTIVEEGEAGDCLYIVDSGRLRVSMVVDGSEIILRELSRETW